MVIFIKRSTLNDFGMLNRSGKEMKYDEQRKVSWKRTIYFTAAFLGSVL